MLKFKINNNFSTSFNEVKFDDLFVSPDLTFISGTTETKYGLQNCNEILVSTDLDVDGKYMPIETYSFRYKGFVIIPTKYKVYECKNDEQVKYIFLSNGKYYYNSTIEPNKISLPSSYDVNYDGTIKYIDYDIVDDYVIYNEFYYIEGDTIETHDGETYDIFISKDIVSGNTIQNFDIKQRNSEKELFYEELSNQEELKTNIIYYYLYETSKEKVKFIIQNIDNPKLTIDFASCCQISTYIIYQDNVIYLDKKDYNNTDIFDLTFKTDTLDGSAISASSLVDKVTVNDNDKSEMKQYFSYKDCDYGSFLHLYLGKTNFYIDETNVIVAQTSNGRERTIVLDRDGDLMYLFHNGKKYFEQNGTYDFITIGNDEYEINYVNETDYNACVNYNGDIIRFKIDAFSSLTFDDDVVNAPISATPMENSEVDEHYEVELKDGTIYYAESSDGMFGCRYKYDTLSSKKISGNTKEITILNQPLYGIKKYKYIEVDGVKYKIYKSSISVPNDTDYDEQEYYYIKFDKGETYRLAIDEIEAPNKLLCHPIIEFYDGKSKVDENGYNVEKLKSEYETNTLDTSLYKQICYDIATNYNLFLFSLENKTLGNIEEVDESLFYTTIEYRVLDLDTLKLYKRLDYFNIPLSIQQMEGNNMNQDDILGNLFVKNETQNAINQIVDMDKDVYYPCYSSNDLKDVNKITFTLHFRTRDLNTWKINEDYTKVYPLTNASDLIPLYDSGNTNWFCTDLYDYKGKQKDILENSDLLYFLNFTTNDVFYHKSNVSNSFLRLLFYDSKNPETQSLLYQATVWLDGDKLYKKYINNINNSEMCNILLSDWKNNNFVKCNKIYTYTEPVKIEKEKITKFTFENDKRLDCSFEITNRYEAKKSAEGFYLHLFKDLTEGICERTIYMKVMFNHAGQGVSCLFTKPMIGSNGKIDIEKMKDGISISEVRDYMYIPLTLIFDEKTNKYVYYPTDNTSCKWDGINNELNFNLFEIKMKDESNSEKNKS